MQRRCGQAARLVRTPERPSRVRASFCFVLKLGEMKAYRSKQIVISEPGLILLALKLLKIEYRNER